MAKKKQKKARARAMPVKASPTPPIKERALASNLSAGWQKMMTFVIIFAVVSPALFAPYGQNGGYSPDLHIAAWMQIVAMLALTLYILACVKRQGITFKKAPTYLPALLFVAWLAASILWAQEKYLAIFATLNWVGATVVGLLIILVIRTPKARHQLLVGIAVSGFLMALLGITQYLFALDLVTQYIAPSGTFNNKNMLGQFCILILPVSLMLMTMEKDRAKAWLYALFVALQATTIFYTHAKGAWLALLVEVLVFALLFLYLKVRYQYGLLADKQKTIMVAAIIVVFLGLSYLQPSMFSKPKDMHAAAVQVDDISFLPDGIEVVKQVVNTAKSSSNIRFIMWRNSWGMFLEHLLVGVGIGNWTSNYDTYQSYDTQDYKLMEGKYHANAHNDYIEILCELGVVGGLFFLWLLVAILFVVYKILSIPAKHFGDGSAMAMALAPLVGLVGIGVCALVSFPLKQSASLLLVVTYVAILSSIYVTLISKPVQTLSLPSRQTSLIFAGGAMAVTVALTYLHINWYISEQNFRLSAYNYTSGKYQSGAQHAATALKHNGLRSQLMWLYGANLLYLGHVKKSLPWLHLALKHNIHSPSTLHSLAAAYSTMKNYRQAATAMAQLYDVQDWPRLLRLQASYLRAGEHYDESVAKLQQLRMRLLSLRDTGEQNPTKEGSEDLILTNNRKLGKLSVLIAEIEALAREKRARDAKQKSQQEP